MAQNARVSTKWLIFFPAVKLHGLQRPFICFAFLATQICNLRSEKRSWLALVLAVAQGGKFYVAFQPAA